jgi:dTDP-glucose pyrophosphorylase
MMTPSQAGRDSDYKFAMRDLRGDAFMKAIILAGGLGSRLSEETTLRPKPMVKIGGKPILSHIMSTYSAHGINEFIIVLGYKQKSHHGTAS